MVCLQNIKFPQENIILLATSNISPKKFNAHRLFNCQLSKGSALSYVLFDCILELNCVVGKVGLEI